MNQAVEYVRKAVKVTAYQTDVELKVETPSGAMTARPGDWVITGEAGNTWICEGDKFDALYQLVEEVENAPVSEC